MKKDPRDILCAIERIGPLERAAQRAVREALAAVRRAKPAPSRKTIKKKAKRR